MRKVDDRKLLEMIQEGIPQKEIAVHFGVSSAYICKRKKQLEAFKEPDGFSRLTDKQKKFALAKVEGKSNTDAAMIAFDVTSRGSAKVLGCNTMKDPDVKTVISDILYQEGIGRRTRIKRLKEIVFGPDMSVALRGLDMANRMDGAYEPEKVEISVQSLVLKIDQEIEELRREEAFLRSIPSEN